MSSTRYLIRAVAILAIVAWAQPANLHGREVCPPLEYSCGSCVENGGEWEYDFAMCNAQGTGWSPWETADGFDSELLCNTDRDEICGED